MRKKSKFYLESSEGWEFPNGLYSVSKVEEGLDAVLGVMSSSRSIAQLDFCIFPEKISLESNEDLELDVWLGEDHLLTVFPKLGEQVQHLRLYFGVAQGKNPLRFTLSRSGTSRGSGASGAQSEFVRSCLPIKFNRLRRLAAP